jgi:hypothetical protein
VNNGLIDEFRRRGVLRVAALYVIAAWLIIQVADVFFPAWGIPESALRYLLTAAIFGFPIAIVFGWMYDITASGIVRTAAAGIDPDTLALIAQNHAVAGDHDAAVAALEVAVASGFRGYFWVLHDARWYGFRDDQRFTDLMAQMKADIDSQRARVEQIDGTDEFKALLELALARSSR